ncbi:MAG: hypothetical protein JAY78_13755 [Candidatus Thiodiazotropha taylori]|nr:hypothetical protein [Candidatus Thiodiazotropha taylori]
MISDYVLTIKQDLSWLIDEQNEISHENKHVMLPLGLGQKPLGLGHLSK